MDGGVACARAPARTLLRHVTAARAPRAQPAAAKPATAAPGGAAVICALRTRRKRSHGCVAAPRF
jgi:hypothetical protein